MNHKDDFTQKQNQDDKQDEPQAEHGHAPHCQVCDTEMIALDTRASHPMVIHLMPPGFSVDYPTLPTGGLRIFGDRAIAEQWEMRMRELEAEPGHRLNGAEIRLIQARIGWG